MIAIVDYGAGNLNSVKKAFDYLGAGVVVTDQPETVAAAGKIVLPGVGHFSSLQALDRAGLREVLLQSVGTGKPFLGICLGMQWLFEGSDESSEVRGAGIFPGKCRQFPSSVKSPHVGWNSLAVKPGHACCEASHRTHLSITRTLSMRRWLLRPRRPLNMDCSLPVPLSETTCSECSFIPKNQEKWGSRS